MTRIVEFRSSEQPHMSISESLYYRLADPLVFRDLDGVLGDIPAACCRRCGEVTLRSDEVANHLCTTTERNDRLVQNGMGVFREIVARKDAEAELAAANARIAELTAALTLAERALQAEQEKYDHILSCEACRAEDGWCPDALGHQIHADELRLAILAAAATPPAGREDRYDASRL